MSGLSGTQAESWVRAAFQTLPDLIILPVCVYLSAVPPPHEETEKKHRCSGLGWVGWRRRETERMEKASKALHRSPGRNADCTFSKFRNPS